MLVIFLYVISNCSSHLYFGQQEEVSQNEESLTVLLVGLPHHLLIGKEIFFFVLWVQILVLLILLPAIVALDMVV